MALSMVTNGHTEGEDALQIWSLILQSATDQLKSQNADETSYLVEPI
jgi:hypothetical protein